MKPEEWRIFSNSFEALLEDLKDDIETFTIKTECGTRGRQWPQVSNLRATWLISRVALVLRGLPSVVGMQPCLIGAADRSLDTAHLQWLLALL